MDCSVSLEESIEIIIFLHGLDLNKSTLYGREMECIVPRNEGSTNKNQKG